MAAVGHYTWNIATDDEIFKIFEILFCCSDLLLSVSVGDNSDESSKLKKSFKKWNAEPFTHAAKLAH